MTLAGFRGRSRISSYGGPLKKIALSGGRRENCWGILCEKSRFYAKKSYFFPIVEGDAKLFGVFHVKNHVLTPKNHIFSNLRGGGGGGYTPGVPPPLDPPLGLTVYCIMVKKKGNL